MEHSPEIEIILNGLTRDRDELSAKLNDVERLIKKIKTGNISFGTNTDLSLTNEVVIEPANQFPHRSEIKVQVIKIIDMIGCACKLNLIQEKHNELTGLRHNLRETVRNLHKHQILKLLKPKGTERGLYWVKTDWLERDNTKLKDEYKFDGFDLIFRDDDLEYI